MSSDYELTTWDDGRVVRVYASGLVREHETGYIVRPAPSTLITAENSPAYHRARRQKTSELIRQRITDETRALSPNAIADAPAAVAEAAAMLWADVVMNSDAYPRDRLEAWKDISRAADVLGEERGQAGVDGNSTDVLTALGRETVTAFIESRKDERRRLLELESASVPVSSAAAGAASAGLGSAAGAGVGLGLGAMVSEQGQEAEQ